MKVEAKVFIDDYTDKLLSYEAEIETEMVNPDSTLPTLTKEFKNFTVSKRIYKDKEIYDATIELPDTTVLIRRIKVLTTDNPSLLNTYRELPKDLQRTDSPFSGIQGYIFIKDLETD